MPLIIICGLPCSGKTKRANELKKIMETYCPSEISNENEKIVKLLKEPRVVHLLNDDSFGLDRINTFSSINEEKKARSMLMSSVERLLNKDTIVIADAMNYIKGFRYQLYCLAKQLRTPHCIVHAAIPIQQAREWHNNRKEEEKYDPEMFENLITRFEEPDSRNRWDSPLFTLLPNDNIEDFAQNIVDALILRKAPPPNLSTISKKPQETNYLYKLDKITQTITNVVVEAQKNGQFGETKVPNCDKKLNVPSRSITLSELRKLKRQFININKTFTSLSLNKVAELFTDYLNDNLS
ncbi:chromatin associated protein KTI12 [Piromyces finnis]|uniref:Chromatin associated protein KTI12 n=1 Tax=Piromyces finnis TaxID=1754191 RepID=A0A1Y1UYK5_9FUNG|nr:chromatin associated protein KTI12 [Piromyces finnis]|eukprot:ORX43595.1 chromatin associated protein KTI12 [Piromyces finnis]